MSDRLAPPLRPAKVPQPETPGLNQLLSLAVGVVVVAALYLAREVLIPITLAVLLSFVLAPLVDLLGRLYLPRVVAVLTAVLLAFAIILSLSSLIGVQVAGLVSDVPRYQTTIREKIETIQSAAIGQTSAVIQRFGHAFDMPRPAPPPPPATRAAPGAETRPMAVEVHQPDPSPVQIAERVLAPVLGPIQTMFIVIIVSVFILLQREDLRDRLIRLFGSGDLHRTTIALDDTARRLSRYFLTQLCVNTGFGCVIAAGLLVIGVPSAVLWGILAGLLRFLPYVGPVLGGIMPVAVAAAVDPGWSLAVWTASLFLVVEMTVGQVVEPLLYGHSTGLSPVSVVVAAIFWTWIWGPIGLILSTPLTLCLVILGRYVDRLEFLDVLLGDRPALTPVENFYQRMLAGDADEALDQAEILLKERSLSSYYDEVAVKGLQLAAADSDRGILTPERLERMRSAIKAVIEDLGGREDADPNPAAADELANATAAEKALPKLPAPHARPPSREARAAEWRGATPILCIVGRGPMDEAAAGMLAQLLAKHGLGARVVPSEAASREAIGSLETDGVAMLCLTGLDIAASTAHMRYLARRARNRVPRAKILVALWPDGQSAADDARMRALVAADYYAASLREAVETCLAEVNETAAARTEHPAAA